MKSWRLVSGIISLVICVLVLFQSCAVGIVNTIENNGQVSGTAGIIVAIMLIAGGIVSIVTRKGGKGGNIAIIILYGMGAVIGFMLAGNYSDLVFWAVWCLACAIVAGVAFVMGYGEADFDDPDDTPAPVAARASGESVRAKPPTPLRVIKWIFIVLGALFLLLIIIGMLAGDPDKDANTPTGGASASATSTSAEYEPNTFYSDSYVTVTFTGIDSSGVQFSVENKANKEIAFVFRTLVLDGKSYSDGNGLIYDSTFIGPKGTGTVTTELDSEYSTDVSIINGTFLYGPSDLSTDGEEVSFSDIRVKQAD